MKVQQLPIYQFLKGSGKSFIIPVYQRDYAWTRINCKKLWDDLVDLKNNKRKDHFLGTVVIIGNGYDTYTVIDGQQRLTTVSILLIALRNFLRNIKTETTEKKISPEEISEFLIKEYSDEEKRIRLKPNKHDKEYFERLFESEKKEKDINIKSNIIDNYNFFYDVIQSELLSSEEIFDAFKKLNIVLITLVRGQDDPQLIFESLNSTGVPLTAGDLIRNYILIDLQPNEQEKFYKTYWVKIERLTNNVAEFVRNYLIFKKRVYVKKDEVYISFKEFSSEEYKGDKELILKDLLYFAEIYSWLAQIKEHSEKQVNEKLTRLNKLESTVSYPYFFDVFNDFNNSQLNAEVVKKILETIESYIFRKIIVDNTTQGLNKLFITLAKEIKKEGLWKNEYLNILNFILLEKRVSQKFPTDDEFENSLLSKEVYKLQSKNRNFLLESLEKFNRSYHVSLDDLSIEHIMPQKLTDEWKTKIGPGWEDVHKKYLHTLGNLTLTAKNIELSNNSFNDKQKIDYQTSKLKLNFNLDNLNRWGEDEITKRAKTLIEEAKHIWVYPSTTYKKKSEEQIFDLTSDDDFTGLSPFRLYIGDDEVGKELNYWIDLLKFTCEFLYDFSPTQFNEVSESHELKRYFEGKEKLRKPVEFVPNKFMEGHHSANGIISLLSKICAKLNYPAENISFSFKNDK